MQDALSLDQGHPTRKQIVERSESEQRCLKIRSHCNRTNYRPAKKFITGHFVHSGPFNIFALFTRNFERLGV